MSDFLEQALKRASNRGDGYVAEAGSAGTYSYDFSSAGAASMMGGYSWSRSSILSHHQEQYKHDRGWVFTATRIRAAKIASQPVRIARWYRKNREAARSMKAANTWQHTHEWKVPTNFKQFHEDMELLEDHALFDVFNYPNPTLTRMGLFYVSIKHWLLTGKIIWWVFKESGRWQIWPLPASWAEPVHTERRLFDSWIIRPTDSAREFVVPAEQIAYLFHPKADDPLGAQSTLQANAEAVAGDESILTANRRSFANSIWPGMAITIGRYPGVPGAPDQRPILTKEQKGQLITAIKSAYKGVVHYDEPVILDGMVERIERISDTNREMDYMNSAKMMKSRIMQGFSTNPLVSGEIENGNRASSVTASENLAEFALNPDIELISEFLTYRMVPIMAPGEDLIVYLEPVHTKDTELMIKEDDMLARHASISRNELRLRHGLPPLANGNNIYIQGIGLVEVERLGQAGTSVNTMAEDEEADENATASEPVGV